MCFVWEVPSQISTMAQRDHLTLRGASTLSQPPAVKPPAGFDPVSFSSISPLLVKALLARYDCRHQVRRLRHSGKIYRASSSTLASSCTLYSLALPLPLYRPSRYDSDLLRQSVSAPVSPPDISWQPICICLLFL